MFRNFFILKQHSDKYQYIFPDNNLLKNVIEEPFLFPCSDIKRYNHGVFVVVLTEISGDRNFLISSYVGNGDTCICFQSDHSWFELLYTAMSVVLRGHLYLPKNLFSLEKYLSSLILLPVPKPGLVIYVPGADPNDNAIKVVVPNNTRQRPFSVFISELRTRLEFDDWLILFESLLLEKWIVFHSCHMDRVTGCIFAALSLLFPMEWVHLIFPCLSEASIDCLGCPSPYIAGMHSCLIERALPLLGNGAIVVDIDQGTLSFLGPENDSSADDDRLPKSLMNFLWRSWSSCDMKIIASKRRSPLGGAEDEKVTGQLLHGFRHALAFLLGRYGKCRVWQPLAGRFSLDKTALGLSRGDAFQPFIGRLLQSQMVHQFLDDKINAPPAHEPGSLGLSLHEMDDFEEACLAMERWQPDAYTDALATMAVRSRRRMNVLAHKVECLGRVAFLSAAIQVLDLAKKADFGSAANDGSDRRYRGLPDGEVIPGELFPGVVVKHLASEPVCELEAPRVRDWIQFEDSSPQLWGPAHEQAWRSGSEVGNLVTFDDWSVPEPRSGPWGQGSAISPSVPCIIRDFDPLFQS